MNLIYFMRIKTTNKVGYQIEQILFSMIKILKYSNYLKYIIKVNWYRANGIVDLVHCS